MAERVTELLVRLATEPRALAEFQRDPEAVAAEAGLSSAEFALITSGNSALLHRAVNGDSEFEAAARAAGADEDGGSIPVLNAVLVVVPTLPDDG